jgi:uncharacterized phage protein (TIGR01671 family)
MRDIKFRAWDGKKMVAVKNIEICDTGYNINMATGLGIVNIKHLMQYTGRKDNIGMEIYESDIMETNGIDGKLLWEVCYVIDSCSSGFKLCGINHNYSSCHNQVWETGKVVGNIHENPELLNRRLRMKPPRIILNLEALDAPVECDISNQHKKVIENNDQAIVVEPKINLRRNITIAQRNFIERHAYISESILEIMKEY